MTGGDLGRLLQVPPSQPKDQCRARSSVTSLVARVCGRCSCTSMRAHTCARAHTHAHPHPGRPAPRWSSSAAGQCPATAHTGGHREVHPPCPELPRGLTASQSRCLSHPGRVSPWKVGGKCWLPPAQPPGPEMLCRPRPFRLPHWLPLRTLCGISANK